MIFVDSWAWIALAARGDREHQPAQEQHRRFLEAKGQYVTTDFVLGEVVTHLYRCHPLSEARDDVNSILSSANAGTYQLVHVSPQQFFRAWIMRQRYHDKPDISFVDFTSFVSHAGTGHQRCRQLHSTFPKLRLREIALCLLGPRHVRFVSKTSLVESS